MQLSGSSDDSGLTLRKTLSADSSVNCCFDELSGMLSVIFSFPLGVLGLFGLFMDFKDFRDETEEKESMKDIKLNVHIRILNRVTSIHAPKW